MSSVALRRAVPRVATIPVGQPFLAVFIEAFASGRLFGRPSPLTPSELAAAEIFVPTRRAGDALLSAFASQADNGAVLLPRIIPLGDEDALDASLERRLAPHIHGPVAVSALDRRLALFGLIERWRDAVAGLRGPAGEREPFYVASSRSDAFALAGDLARLIDEMIIEDVPLDRLAAAMPASYDPERHDDYWRLTQTFLSIAAKAWPETLSEWQQCDAATITRDSLRRLAGCLAEAPPPTPMVVAGSTGSVAATADLMAAIARLPMGAVVLPGLDLTLDDASWSRIGHAAADLPTRYAHPQALLKRTLDRIGLQRSEVQRLGLAGTTPAESLASEVFRPAEATALWQTRALSEAERADAEARLSLIEAADAREEALAIALVLRETLETPGKTAALITPDRQLTQGVIAELQRWGIVATESAGVPLAGTPMAGLARLALQVAESGAARDLLAVLRHPLCRLGLSDAERADVVSAVEIAGLRGQRFGRSVLQRLPQVLAEAQKKPASRRDPAPRRRLSPDRLAAAETHACRASAAIGRFLAVFAASGPSLAGAAAAHRALCEALLEDDSAADDWNRRDDGRALAGVFDQLTGNRLDLADLTLADYIGLFEALLAEETIRTWQPAHPRLKIWGLLESRLIDADRILLAGLNEGVFPPEARADAFLNRSMRIALGLQPPERRIGQSAHDFMMGLGGREVFLCRAARRDGAPTVASRFLRRLTAYLGAGTGAVLSQKGQRYIALARALDLPDQVVAAERPAPRVPPDLFPDELNLTEIETLYRDPYRIFARRVLGLDELDPIEPPLDARDPGIAVHQALADYSRIAGALAPERREEALLSAGAQAFAGMGREAPDTFAFWWRQFSGFAPWFVQWDTQRRSALVRLHVECSGRLALELTGGRRLTLIGRADRIEERSDAFDQPGLAVIDYKTGTVPGSREVLAGLAPQLPLTAALAMRGAFSGLARPTQAPFVSLFHVAVARADGQGKQHGVQSLHETLAEVSEAQLARLISHLDQYLKGEIGFLSRRIPRKRDYSSGYDHLARHLEWSLAGEGDDVTDEAEGEA